MRVLVIVVAIFVLMTVFSAYFVYYEITLPNTSRNVTSPILDYTANADYAYVATLWPNALYNSTTLQSGQGTLFSNLTKMITVTFSYGISSDHPANFSLSLGFVETLIGSSWNKTLYQNSTRVNSANSGQVSIVKLFPLNVTEITSLVNLIERQTGLTDQSYTVLIQPTINGSIAASGVGTVFQDAPAYNFTFSRTFGAAGATIQPSPALYSASRTLSRIIAVQQASSSLERNLSLAMLSGSSITLLVSVWFYWKSPPSPKSRSIERRLAPYQEIVSSTSTPPREEDSIVLNSLEDLIKIADTIGKPILRYSPQIGGELSQYYVMDGVRYYIFRAADLLPREKP